MIHHEVVVLLLSVGILLTAARAFGEAARFLGQPAVVGELLAGIVLGPTVLGRLAPETFAALFPAVGAGAVALQAFSTIAIVFFLLVAGMEVDLSSAWRQGRAALVVGVAGMTVPFALGFCAAFATPRLLGMEPGADLLVFSLFFATALAISALPVIAKTLLDLKLYRSDFGMIVMPAAMLNDIVGWSVFAMILGMMGRESEFGWSETIGLTLVFAAAVLTAGRYAIHRMLPWVQAHLAWPGGVIAFSLALTLFGAAFTEWIGIHAIFGAFLVGIALGDSAHLREETRFTMQSFISFFFAPLFFAGIGLRVDFLAHFDPWLVAVVLVIATAGKFAGCLLGARFAGLPRRMGLAVGVAMNARGAMEIVLGLLALQHGVIRERMFVALVVMALVTSIMSGPLLKRILRLKKPRRFTDFLRPAGFRARLRATEAEAAILELTALAAASAPGIDADAIVGAVLERERLQHTGLGNGLAMPHARIAGLVAPIVAVGLSPEGVDFDAPDGQLARVVCLVLVPAERDDMHIEIVADLARTFANTQLRQGLALVQGYTEFLALTRLSGVAAGAARSKA